MIVKQLVPIIRVTDMRAALEFYCSRIGFVKDFSYSASPDGPTYTGVSLDGNQLHLSTFEGDGIAGAAVYCYVDDVDDLFRKAQRAGLKPRENSDSPVEEGPVDQTWGMREFYVRDPDGNTLRFGSPSSQAG